MILGLAIDTEALKSASASQHQRFLQIWRRYGALVYDRKSMRALVGSLKPGVRKKWQEALKYQRAHRQSGLSFEGIEAIEQFKALPACVNLACVEEVRGAYLGLTEDEFKKRVPISALEVCLLDSLEVSDSVLATQELATSEIASGSNVSDVLDVRFASLIRYAPKTLVIVDRYVLLNHIDKPRTSGLRNFLARLGESEVRRRLVLYVTPKDHHPDFCFDQIAQILNSLPQRRGIGDVTVYLIRNRDFGMHAHDRYVRFGDIACWLGRGLEALGGDTVEPGTSFSLDHDVKAKRERESTLRDRSFRERTIQVAL